MTALPAPRALDLAIARMWAHGRLASRVTIRRGARIAINERWRIARALPADMRFDKPLAEHLAYVNRAIAKLRVAGINGHYVYDRDWLIGLLQVRLALRWIRRFEGEAC